MTTRKQSRREHEKIYVLSGHRSRQRLSSRLRRPRRGREDRLLHACPLRRLDHAKPVQSANGAVVAIVQYPDGQGAVSVTVTPAPLPAKDLAVQTLNNMKSGGFTVSEPVASGDSYVGEFSQQQARGVSYFTSNGKLGSVITIVGTDTRPGKDFLNKNFKAADAKLFPASF